MPAISSTTIVSIITTSVISWCARDNPRHVHQLSTSRFYIGLVEDTGKLADVREMYMVHTMLRREFAALPALVRGVVAGDGARANLIAEHIDVLVAVLHAHHHAEDTHLWPKLRDRGGAELGPVIQTMQGQHERIETVTARTAAAPDEWRENAAEEPGGRLADLLEVLYGVLYEHMNLEEQHILPLAKKYVTAVEWHAMASASGAALPPGKMPLIFGMTQYEADPEVMANTLSALPPEVRTMLEEQGARDFAAHSERIHGTPTPRRGAPLEPARS
jgi:hemerythrin-like domain-containing protein